MRANEAISGFRKLGVHSVERRAYSQKTRHSVIGIFEEVVKETIVTVNDRMQSDYQYVLVEPQGKNYAPDFKPELTPAEMLELGVFGGKYMTDCQDEFPKSWFVNARLSPAGADPSINFFGVHASQPLSEWNRKGWIFADDPRGWFQWYCRYYMGRRGPDDERQVHRWRMMTRHRAQVVKNCPKMELTCRKKQRQALLHWGYDSRLM